MAEPAVTVVVPTYNRARLLPRLVDALATQEGVDFDVVIVDDASPDDTPSVLNRLAAAAPFDLRVVRVEENGGPARARNIGWRRATAPLVAFTDDDCVADPGWLAALVKRFESADVVVGQTRPNPDQRGTGGPFPHFVNETSDRGIYQTCNIGYRREILEKAGGFFEGFRYAYGEDADLGWSAREAGARIAFEPEALVYHDVWRWTFRQYVAHSRFLGDAVVLAKRHPGVRDLYPSRWLYRRSHRPALAAVAGLAVAAVAPSRPARAAGLALVAPYLRHRLVDNPLPVRKRYRALYVTPAFIRDLAEITVMARASVRHRTLLL